MKNILKLLPQKKNLCASWCMHAPWWRNMYLLICFFRRYCEPNEIGLSFSNEHNCFCNWYSMPFERMFGESNVPKISSALNWMIIYVKPFTSTDDNMAFWVSFLNAEWNIISPFSFKHIITDSIQYFIEYWQTDLAIIHKWYSFPNALISYNSVGYFNFYVISS